MGVSKERQYELVLGQLSAHIQRCVACEIADAIYEGNKERLETAITTEVPKQDIGKVRRILNRIAEVCDGKIDNNL